MPQEGHEYSAPPPPPDPVSTIVLPSDHRGSADALREFMRDWGLENSDIAAIPLFPTRRLNEERPRDKTTETLDDE